MGFTDDYFLKVIEGAPILISFIKSNHWDSQTITFWKLSKVRQFWFLLRGNLFVKKSNPLFCKGTVTGSRLTGYTVNVVRSPVIERLMVRGSQVALKHVIHDMVTRTLVMELRRCAIKRWVPCSDMDCRLKIPHSAKVECGFRILSRNAYVIAV